MEGGEESRRDKKEIAQTEVKKILKNGKKNIESMVKERKKLQKMKK